MSFSYRATFIHQVNVRNHIEHYEVKIYYHGKIFTNEISIVRNNEKCALQN